MMLQLNMNAIKQKTLTKSKYDDIQEEGSRIGGNVDEESGGKGKGKLDGKLNAESAGLCRAYNRYISNQSMQMQYVCINNRSYLHQRTCCSTIVCRLHQKLCIIKQLCNMLREIFLSCFSGPKVNRDYILLEDN